MITRDIFKGNSKITEKIISRDRVKTKISKTFYNKQGISVKFKNKWKKINILIIWQAKVKVNKTIYITSLITELHKTIVIFVIKIYFWPKGITRKNWTYYNEILEFFIKTNVSFIHEKICWHLIPILGNQCDIYNNGISIWSNTGIEIYSSLDSSCKRIDRYRSIKQV